LERDEDVPLESDAVSLHRGVRKEEGDVADANLAVVDPNLAVVDSILAVVSALRGLRRPKRTERFVDVASDGEADRDRDYPTPTTTSFLPYELFAAAVRSAFR
jgi:hypothetical protein